MTEEVRATPAGEKPPSPPRDVPAWAQSRGSRMLKAAGPGLMVAALVGSAISYGVVGTAEPDRARDARGTEVMGTPIKHRLSSTSQNGAVERYAITFRYRDSSGRDQTTTIESVHTSQVEAAEAKKPLRIEVDPENPRHARWPGRRLNPVGNLPYALTALLGALGALLGIVGVWQARRERALFREGRALEGEVTSVESFVDNRRTHHRVAYRYTAPEGDTVDGLFTARDVEEPKRGPLWVLVAPDDAWRSIPVLKG